MSNIILFGSSGHLGFNVAKQLLIHNHKIICLVRKKNLYTHILENLRCTVKIINFNNLTNIIEFNKKFIIINTAAKNEQSQNNSDNNEDLKLLKSIIKFSDNNNINKIIHVGSSVIYSRNIDKLLINESSEKNYFENDYTKRKIECDEFLLKYQKKNSKKIIIRVNPSWIVGPDDKFITPPIKFIKNYIDKKKFILYTNGGISINTVENISEGIVNSIKYNKSIDLIFGGYNLSFKELICSYKKLTNQKFVNFKIPTFILSIISKIISLLNLGFLSKFNDSLLSNINALTNFSYIDSKKAIKEINYKIAKKDKILQNIILSIQKYNNNLNLVGYGYYFNNIDKEFFNNKFYERIFITGFPGVLGNRFIEFIISYNRINKYKINCNLLVENKYKNQFSLPSNFKIYYGSLENIKVINNALRDSEIVFHLAGAIYNKNNLEIYKSNYTDSKNLVDLSIKNGISKFILMSSDSVAGYTKNNRLMEIDQKKPTGAYGRSKLLIEQYLIKKYKFHKMNYTILRGFWFFDITFSKRNQKFVENIIDGKQYLFGNGLNLRNVSLTENVVINFFKCIKYKKTNNNIYWVGEDNNLTFSDIYKQICKINNKKFKPIYLPKFILFFLRIMYKLFDFIGINIPILFSLSKLDMSISGDSSKIYQDTNNLKISNFYEIGKYE